MLCVIPLLLALPVVLVLIGGRASRTSHSVMVWPRIEAIEMRHSIRIENCRLGWIRSPVVEHAESVVSFQIACVRLALSIGLIADVETLI